MLRTILIVSGVCLAVFINFVFYCCIRVASMADRRMEKLMSEKNDQKKD